MGFKDRRILNIAYIVLLLAGLLIPYLELVAFGLALASEVIHRREFFQKVIYYGVPGV
nr:hypothetical protein [Metallosphaera hakonensis]